MPQTPARNSIKLATPAEGISPMVRHRRDITFRKADVMRAIRPRKLSASQTRASRSTDMERSRSFSAFPRRRIALTSSIRGTRYCPMLRTKAAFLSIAAGTRSQRQAAHPIS